MVMADDGHLWNMLWRIVGSNPAGPTNVLNVSHLRKRTR
jgi:hypothetical protein